MASVACLRMVKSEPTHTISSLHCGLGFAMDQGSRKYQEDAFDYFRPVSHLTHDNSTSATTTLPPVPRTKRSKVHASYALASVYDGHGGDLCSSLAKTFVSSMMSLYPTEEVISRPKKCLMDAFIKAGQKIGQILDTEDNDSGATAVSVLITKNKIVVANMGDCRAVLSRQGEAVELSRDHTLENPVERARVRAVNKAAVRSNGRVFGQLAVTRSFGDRQYPKTVISMPEIEEVCIKPQDEFIIVASDGLWGSLNSQQAVNYVRRCIVNGQCRDTAGLAEMLVKKAISCCNGKPDNTTVCIVALNQTDA